MNEYNQQHQQDDQTPPQAPENTLQGYDNLGFVVLTCKYIKIKIVKINQK